MPRRNRYLPLRHMLDHAREAVDMDILWQIIEHDLPPLIAALETILRQEGAE